MPSVSAARLDATAIDILLKDRLSPVDYAGETVCVDVLSTAYARRQAGKPVDPLAHYRACRERNDAAVRHGESPWYAKPQRKWEGLRRVVSALSSVSVGGDVGVSAGVHGSFSFSVAPFDVLSKTVLEPLFFQPAEERWAADRAAVANAARHDLLRTAGYLGKRHVMTEALSRVDEPEFMELLDTALRERTGIDLTDPAARSWATVAAAHPGVATVFDRADLPQPAPDGTGELAPERVEELRAELTGELTRARESVGEIVTSVAEISRQQGETLAALTVWREDQQRQQDAAALRARVDAARAALGDGRRAAQGLAQILGLVDADLGRRASAAAAATFAIHDSVMDFAANTTTLAAAGELTKLATMAGSLALTGNIIGAGLSLVSALGPSTDDLILGAVEQLRQEVGRLREEMREHFRRVDARLDEIFTRLDDGFRRTQQLIAGVEGRIEDVQQLLVDLDSQVDAMGGYLLTLHGEAAAMSLVEAVNEIHPRRGGHLSEDRFYALEGLLHTWCTEHASGELYSGDDRSVALGDLPAVLGGTPLSANLNQVDKALRTLTGPDGGFVRPGGAIANPAVWLTAARTYATLVLGWPRTAVDVLGETEPGRMARVREVGQAIAVDLARIAVPGHDATFDYTDPSAAPTPAGPLDPAPALRRFDALVDVWRDAMGGFADHLNREEARLVADYRKNRERSALVGDHGLWAPLKAPWNGLPAPHGLEVLLSGEDLLAVSLGIDPAPTWSCSASWRNVTTTFRKNPVGEPIEHVSGDLAVTCSLADGGSVTVEGSRASRPFRLPQAGPLMRERWESGDGFKARLEAALARHPGAGPGSPRDDVSAVIRLRVRDDVRKGVDGPDAVGSALRAEGARLLLRAVVEAGFPDTFAADEVLRAMLVRPFDADGDLRDIALAAFAAPDPFAVLRSRIDQSVAALRDRLHQHVHRISGGPLEVSEDVLDCLAMLAAAEGVIKPARGTFRPGPGATAGRRPRTATADLALDPQTSYEVVAFTDLGDEVDGDPGWFRIVVSESALPAWVSAAGGVFTGAA